jgi:hypothetical protein
MAHITEHHSEEEWEGHDRHWYWVCFLVVWHSISVNNHLEDSCEICSLKVSWPWNGVIVISNDLGSAILLQSTSYKVLLLDWSPEISDKTLVLPFHLIEGFVKSLFFSQEHLVDVDGGRGLSFLVTITFDLIKLDELVSQRLLCPVKHTSGISNRLGNLLDLWGDFLQVRELKSLARETVTYFLNSFSDVLSIPEDNDVHRSLLGSISIDILLSVHV